MANDALTVTCCIAGGGPAGMMLGYLLARAGVRVAVLEKHADFLRDFRGDTIHPSTLEVVHELGLLDALLKLPHQEVRQLNAQFGDATVTLADFTRLPTRCKFIAMMPQWDFLNFLAARAARYPAFKLLMETEATDPVEEAGRVSGVRARGKDGPLEVRADLVVAADGRGSILREKAGLSVKDLGAPMDVLWFRLSRKPDDPAQTMGRFDVGRIFVTINRGDSWQCGFVIPKGGFEEVRRQGLEAFREKVAELAPYAQDRVAELRTWDDVKLLTVRVDRLIEWFRPGLLCIGDAAHAMSPVGGVGINLAIQDAVAAANILAGPLGARRAAAEDLRRVQRRREFPTRVTQSLQVAVQKRFIARALD
ncbi:MAG TPA: FAD-dependent oxidoreductase, partial [Candidatus Binatia bacterium]